MLAHAGAGRRSALCVVCENQALQLASFQGPEVLTLALASNFLKKHFFGKLLPSWMLKWLYDFFPCRKQPRTNSRLSMYSNDALIPCLSILRVFWWSLSFATLCGLLFALTARCFWMSTMLLADLIRRKTFCKASF